MKKCVIFSAKGEASFTTLQLEKLKSLLDVTFIESINSRSDKEIIELTRNFEIIGITRRTTKNLNGNILSNLPIIKSIAIYSTGYEWIDLNVAHDNNVEISFLPEYSAQTVAEHTMAVLLTLTRRIHLSYDKVRGNIPETTSLRGMELSGKTLGIIGLGRIGKRFAKLAEAFGMKIIFYDIKKIFSPYKSCDSIESLIKISDIVTLLTPQTRDQNPIFTKNEIDLIENSIILINTSRSDLVDNKAIIDGIEQKKIYGYAVDDTVDLFQNSKIEDGRILQTGHTAWYSDEAILRGTNQWVENILAFAKDEPINLIKKDNNG